MDLTTAMTMLRKKGKATTATAYRRHGVVGECLGVSYSDLASLERRIGVNHELALGLWKSGVHDARILATRVCEPEHLDKDELEAWIADADNYVITGAITTVAAKRKDASVTAARWTARKDEWRSSAGWGIYAQLVMDGRVDDMAARKLLVRIGKELAGAPNRTRYAMNGTLIAIGGKLAAVRADALAVAAALGVVEVDHGETGCKTPAAAAYIERMVEHEAKRTATKA